MKQLHGKTKSTIISYNNNNNNPQQQQQQQQQPQVEQNVENKFRCRVLPEHFTGAIPFVRVNNILNFDWFVWMPDNINAGDTFVFIILKEDLIKAQEFRHQEQTSTLTPTEQLNYNTKVVNEICKDIPVNTRPTRQQQELILQALHPYVPIISNCIIESRNGVTCPIFYKIHGPLATNNNESNNSTMQQNKNNVTRKSMSIKDHIHEMEQIFKELYTFTFPSMYHEICNVDTTRLLLLVIGYIFTFVLGFMVAIIYQDIINNNGQCRI